MYAIVVIGPRLRRIARGALLLCVLVNAGVLLTPFADSARAGDDLAENQATGEMANESGMIGDIRTVISGEAGRGDARRIYDRP
jgi:hypothetical protein